MRTKLKPKKCAYSKCKQPFTPKYSTLEKCCCKYHEIMFKIESCKNNNKNEKNLSYTQKRNEVKILAQKNARLRDAGMGCISCGTKIARQWHGGHLFKAEIFTGVILNEYNINIQCDTCNIELDGNFEGYKKGFIERYGQEKFNELETEANATRNKKWSYQELEDILEYYKKKIKNII